MRNKHIVNVHITEDTAGEDPLFGTSNSGRREQTIDNMQRENSGHLNIAAAGTENLPFGDVDAVRGVYIRSDTDFDVVFNAGGDTIQMRKADAATGRVVTLFMEGIFTQVAVTNADAVNALNAIYVVWGDPTP